MNTDMQNICGVRYKLTLLPLTSQRFCKAGVKPRLNISEHAHHQLIFIKDKLHDIRTHLRDTEESLSRLDNIDDLKTRLREAKESLSQKDVKIAKLRASHADSEQAHRVTKDMRDEILRLKDEIETLRNQKAKDESFNISIAEEANELRKAIAGKDREIASLRKEQDTRGYELATKTKALKTSSEEQLGLKEQIDELQKGVYRNQVSQLISTIEENVVSKIDRLDTTYRSDIQLRDQIINNSRQKLKRRQEDIVEMRKRRDTARTKATQYRQDRNEVISELQTLKQRTTTLSDCRFHLVYHMYTALLEDEDILKERCGSVEWDMNAPMDELRHVTEADIKNFIKAISTAFKHIRKTSCATKKLKAQREDVLQKLKVAYRKNIAIQQQKNFITKQNRLLKESGTNMARKLKQIYETVMPTVANMKLITHRYEEEMGRFHAAAANIPSRR